MAPSSEPIIIKKYANRRLYNTETSQYITLQDLADIIRSGREVEVVDAKTGQDLTRATFAQIIFDEEGKGAAMLPVNFLKTIISFYDNSMQSILPHYLEMVMDVFQQNQSRIREETNKALGGFSPFAQMAQMQQIQRTQLAQMQQVMGLFNPFLRMGQPGGAPASPLSQKASEEARQKAERIATLEAELAKLKMQK